MSTRKKTRRLLEIKVDEISPVDRPAIVEEFFFVKSVESANAIKAARTEKGVTVAQLAEESGVPEARIEELEGGADPTMAEAKAIAKALGVEPSDLYFEAETEDDSSAAGDPPTNPEQKKAEGDMDEAEPSSSDEEPEAGDGKFPVHRQIAKERAEMIEVLAGKVAAHALAGDVEEARRAGSALSEMVWSLAGEASTLAIAKSLGQTSFAIDDMVKSDQFNEAAARAMRLLKGTEGGEMEDRGAERQTETGRGQASSGLSEEVGKALTDAAVAIGAMVKKAGFENLSDLLEKAKEAAPDLYAAWSALGVLKAAAAEEDSEEDSKGEDASGQSSKDDDEMQKLVSDLEKRVRAIESVGVSKAAPDDGRSGKSPGGPDWNRVIFG